MHHCWLMMTTTLSATFNLLFHYDLSQYLAKVGKVFQSDKETNHNSQHIAIEKTSYGDEASHFMYSPPIEPSTPTILWTVFAVVIAVVLPCASGCTLPPSIHHCYSEQTCSQFGDFLP
eukprot:328127_1